LGARTAVQTVDAVSVIEQELREIPAVLTSDPVMSARLIANRFYAAAVTSKRLIDARPPPGVLRGSGARILPT